MEKQLQIVKLGCIIYLVYGLFTLLELGVFLPPTPLKLVFIAAFALILGVRNFRKNKKLYFYLILYGISVLLTTAFFLEIFLNTEARIQLEEANVLDFTSLASLILLTIILFYLTFQNINQKARFNILPLLVIIAIWLDSFFPNFYISNGIFIFFGLMLYLTMQRSNLDYSEDELLGIRIFFIGIAGIYLITSISEIFI